MDDAVEEPCLEEQGMCTSCENVRALRQANAPAFNEDPRGVVFNFTGSTPEQHDLFWSRLERVCGIQRPATSNVNAEPYVAEPDAAAAKQNHRVVVRRAGPREDVKRFADFLLALVRLYPRFRAMLPLPAKVRHRDAQELVREAARTTKVRTTLSHHPFELPLGAAILLDDLARADRAGFGRAARFLTTRPQACVEGTLETATKLAR